MLRRVLFALVVAVCLGLTCHGVMAQEVVHALTGTVSSIDPVDKSITVFLDGGSEGVFKDMTNAKTPLSFDKKLHSEATAADAFTTKGAYAIVYYFGGTGTRTAVAVRSLGTGPFTAAQGTVAKYESHEHAISVGELRRGSGRSEVSGPEGRSCARCRYVPKWKPDRPVCN